jgi:hypothetical protein
MTTLNKSSDYPSGLSGLSKDGQPVTAAFADSGSVTTATLGNGSVTISLVGPAGQGDIVVPTQKLTDGTQLSNGGKMDNGTPPKPKKRLVRKRRADLALETALRDAAAATERGADASVLNLLRARLNILNQQLTRERNEKFKRALADVERLRGENVRLKQELESRAKPTSRPMSEVEQALEKYEREKR